MKIKHKEKPLTNIQTLRAGQVFKYKNDYYIVTDRFKGEWTLMEQRIYVNLKNGAGILIPKEHVEVVEDISLVIGD